jgi:DNA-binding GntR family transcriptional regulator
VLFWWQLSQWLEEYVMDFREIMERVAVPGEGPVAKRVQYALLAAIAEGHLIAGDALHDHEWATALGMSRTPVREAFQHLQGMGLLDVAAARYTRLRRFTPDEAIREAQDWSLLHNALTRSLTETAPEGLTDRLCLIRDAFIGRSHPDHVRLGSFQFFQALRAAAPHSAVTLGATAAAYRLRLAEPQLSHCPNAHAVIHDGVIRALTTGNHAHADRALTDWTTDFALAA